MPPLENHPLKFCQSTKVCNCNPQRLVGLALISLEDIQEAVQELERCAKRGLKGALISVSPDAEKQYDNPVYDPFWAAAQDL